VQKITGLSLETIKELRN